MKQLGISQNRFVISLIIAVFATYFVTVSTYMVGTRGDHVGADTVAYKYYFNNLAESVLDDKFEPFFYLVAKIAATIGSIEIFFGLVNVIFFIALFLFVKRLKLDTDYVVFLLLLLGFVHLSNWYITAVTNGLRQGLAIPFIFLAYLCLYQKKTFWFVIYSLIACGFHYSSILILPFAVLLRINSDRLFIFIFSLVSIGYVTGINEWCIETISNFLGLPVYSLIKNYGGGNGPWNGFNFLFFVYSSFWFWAPFTLLFCYGSKVNRDLKLLIYTYGTLLIPYFIFGFGPFSNRYAFPAWLFLPILYSGIIYYLKISRSFKLFAAILLLLLTVVKLGLIFL